MSAGKHWIQSAENDNIVKKGGINELWNCGHIFR